MFCNEKMTERERFINVMEYKAVDRVPNHEAGVWEQTKERWVREGINKFEFQWDWFTGDEYFNMDAREFFDIHYGMMPPFDYELIEKTEINHGKNRKTKLGNKMRAVRLQVAF